MPRSRKQSKLSFREIASRITGVSIPIFGVSWNPPEPERKIIRDLLVFLEDRRALYVDHAFEIEHEVSDSVHEIRRELTDCLRRLPEGSEAVNSVRALRVACREYLTNVRARYHQAYLIELGRLRALCGVHIAYLAVKFGIDIEGDRASIIPPELAKGFHDE